MIHILWGPAWLCASVRLVEAKGLSHTRSSGLFHWQDNSERQPTTCETQEKNECWTVAVL